MTPTDEQITAAARALSNDNADTCNVNREDNWNIYGDSFRETARVALEAAMASAPAVDAGASEDDLVLVPRGLLGAACSAIDKKRDAPNVLAKLRTITLADAFADQEPLFEAWLKTYVSRSLHDPISVARDAWDACAALSSRASEAAAGEPVGYFINDAPQGMKPHYAQVDEQFKSNPDVIALVRERFSEQNTDVGGERVAKVICADEYGPMLEWSTHWVDLIGKSLYTTPPPAKLSTDSVDKAVVKLTTEQIDAIRELFHPNEMPSRATVSVIARALLAASDSQGGAA